MRTREKTYCDYGFKENEADKLKSYIRGEDFTEDELLMQCCKESYDYLSDFLYLSLRERISYQKLSTKSFIPMGADDFYGYQRKALYLFRERLIAEGKYYKDDGR